MFDQDLNEQANISGADLALLVDELATARMQRDLLLHELKVSTNGLRIVSRWNISEQTASAITTQIIANEVAITKVEKGDDSCSPVVTGSLPA